MVPLGHLLPKGAPHFIPNAEKDIHDVRIKLLAGVLENFNAGLSEGTSGTIGPAGGDDIEGVATAKMRASSGIASPANPCGYPPPSFLS